MAPRIRVDQSHCNFQLSSFLQREGWAVLFRDPGRVSRGIAGDQATILGVFERRGWPIPDIAAVKAGTLLLIEVDHGLTKALPSLLTYRVIERQLLTDMNTAFSGNYPISQLILAFCKIGQTTALDTLKASNKLDLLVGFHDPMEPSLQWLNKLPDHA